MTRRHRTVPHLERILGHPDRFRLSLQGVRFELSRLDLLTLGDDLQRVLVSLARDERAEQPPQRETQP